MRLACDIDGVLADWVGACRRWLVSHGGRDHPALVRPTARIALSELPARERRILTAAQDDPDFWREIRPYPDALSPDASSLTLATADLARAGHEVVYLTSRPLAYESLTAAWLARYGVSDPSVVTAPSAEKAPRARALAVDWLIEDDPMAVAVAAAADLPTVLIRRPWNRRVRLGPTILTAPSVRLVVRLLAAPGWPTPFARWAGEVASLLDGQARRKGYSTGLAGPNALYTLVASLGQGPWHGLGEIIYKATRYGARRDREDLIKIAAWAYLIARHEETEAPRRGDALDGERIREWPQPRHKEASPC